jgi:hydrogenase maturation protease
MTKTLILGLGNPILTDDGVGVHVVRAVQKARPQNGMACAEASVGGLRLLDALTGYERVVLVDAIQTHDGRPGDVYRLHLDDVQGSLHSGSTHDLSLAGALAVGRRLGMELPGDDAIVIVAIEVADVLTFGETCTPVVTDAIPAAVCAVLDELVLS